MIELAEPGTVATTLTAAYNFAANALSSDMAKPILGAVAGTIGTLGIQKIRNKIKFNKAAHGNRVSPEIKISLLQWEESQTPNGQIVYDLHSSTKSMDLRKVLADEYKEELPKYIVAAAREATEDSPFIVDHIDAATHRYSDLFKSKASREDFAKRIHGFIDEETKYIIQGQWGGGSVLQQAYEVGAEGMEGFYGVWMHQSSDNVEEIRLLILPEKCLTEPLPRPDQVRVREGEKGGDGFYEDATGKHSHIQRLKIMHKAVEKLKSDSKLRGNAWISLPVKNIQPAPTAHAVTYMKDTITEPTLSVN